MKTATIQVEITFKEKFARNEQVMYKHCIPDAEKILRI